ncbi:MAG: hypothetical protein PVJ57_16280 [Phycisphaerae bacterium]
MPLWDWLFGGKDPSADWVADPAVAHVLDLDRPSLCGIALGDSADEIARLGPPENRHATRDEQYSYDKHGFTIDVDERAVSGFIIFFVEVKGLRCTPFSGEAVHAGQTFTLSAETREGEWRERFGEPYWRDADKGEILLFYELGDVEWQVEFDRTGHLRVLNIVTPPMFNDARQRAAYGVDKPWPPR